MTLGGLAIAIGEPVDNAVVDVEALRTIRRTFSDLPLLDVEPSRPAPGLIDENDPQLP